MSQQRMLLMFDRLGKADTFCLAGDGTPAIEVAFDGTIYDLETGKVRCTSKTMMQFDNFVIEVSETIALERILAD